MAVFDSKVIILPTLEVVDGFSSERVPDRPVMEDAALTGCEALTVCERVVGGVGDELKLLNKLDMGSIREDAAAGALEELSFGGLEEVAGGCLLLD